MSYIKAFAKELAETVIRTIKKTKVSKKNKKRYAKEFDALSNDGFYVLENYLNKSECDKLIKEIDSIVQEGKANIWHDEQGADSRIYYIDTISENFKKIYETPYFRDVLQVYTGNSDPKGMLLAGRIDAVEGNLGSGGGWHRDSPFYHQTKAIIYLSDVNEDNGPFQYIPESQSKSDVFKSYIKKIFRPGQYRFTEEEIASYCDARGKDIIDMTAKAGTLVFADTKGIHRGKPIKEGRRYVLFCYYWDGKIPKHFNMLKQNEST